MTDESTRRNRCRQHRRRILEIARRVPAAHVAPAFSCVEIVDALYYDIMGPRDIFIMSKGHGCLAQYVVLERLRWINDHTHENPLDDYCQPNGLLGAHPDYIPELGLHASTGSLGHGLGIAAGQALAERLLGTNVRVYVLLSDGECQEGSTWEAAMVAANLRLYNLRILVDYNGWGGMDRTDGREPFRALQPLFNKFSAFGWYVREYSGHDYLDEMAKWIGNGGPVMRAAICRTIKGKGVSFMTDDPIWHYRSPTAEEYAIALRELGTEEE